MKQKNAKKTPVFAIVLIAFIAVSMLGFGNIFTALPPDAQPAVPSSTDEQVVADRATSSKVLPSLTPSASSSNASSGNPGGLSR